MTMQSGLSEANILPIGRLLFQVDAWHQALITPKITEVAWQAGNYPNGEQWAQIQTTSQFETIEVFARFGSTAIPNMPTLAEQVQNVLLLLEAARRQCVHLKLVLPYMPYSLQDRDARGGDAIAAKVFVKSVEALQVDEVVLLDLHSPRDQEYWSIPVTQLSAEDLLIAGIRQMVDTSQTVLLAPDKGAAHRAHQIGEILNVPVTYLTKVRLGPGQVKIDTSNLDGLEAKHVVLVDDLLNTGGTLIAASQALHERDPQVQVYVAITHGLFANNALEKLRTAHMKRIIMTDSYLGEVNPDDELVEILSLREFFSASHV